MYKSQWYGWLPDLPDGRDHRYAAPRETVKALPPSADLTAGCPPVYNQGNLGSCTANAIAAAVEFDLIKEKKKRVFVPSRLFLYYNERAMEGHTSSDSGAQVRDGIKSVVNQGDCPETLWPYVIKNFAEKPPKNCYSDALKYRAVEYQRVDRKIDQFRGCLASGYPFAFGFTAYDGFESSQVAKTGRLQMPKPNEKVVGGHAVLAVGYNSAQQTFLVRNSWGTDWGMKGYFTMPFDYLLNSNLSDDFWTVRVVT
jgi:C1A family cysteine protease